MEVHPPARVLKGRCHFLLLELFVDVLKEGIFSEKIFCISSYFDMFLYAHEDQLSLVLTERLSAFKCTGPSRVYLWSLNLQAYTLFFNKEPTSRPSSKSSLFIDLKSANCSTKSSLIVP